jgi:hypothetical protein
MRLAGISLLRAGPRVQEHALGVTTIRVHNEHLSVIPLIPPRGAIREVSGAARIAVLPVLGPPMRDLPVTATAAPPPPGLRTHARLVTGTAVRRAPVLRRRARLVTATVARRGPIPLLMPAPRATVTGVRRAAGLRIHAPRVTARAQAAPSGRPLAIARRPVGVQPPAPVLPTPGRGATAMPRPVTATVIAGEAGLELAVIRVTAAQGRHQVAEVASIDPIGRYCRGQ